MIDRGKMERLLSWKGCQMWDLFVVEHKSMGARYLPSLLSALGELPMVTKKVETHQSCLVKLLTEIETEN